MIVLGIPPDIKFVNNAAKDVEVKALESVCVEILPPIEYNVPDPDDPTKETPSIVVELPPKFTAT